MKFIPRKSTYIDPQGVLHAIPAPVNAPKLAGFIGATFAHSPEYLREIGHPSVHQPAPVKQQCDVQQQPVAARSVYTPKVGDFLMVGDNGMDWVLRQIIRLDTNPAHVWIVNQHQIAYEMQMALCKELCCIWRLPTEAERAPVPAAPAQEQWMPKVGERVMVANFAGSLIWMTAHCTACIAADENFTGGIDALVEGEGAAMHWKHYRQPTVEEHAKFMRPATPQPAPQAQERGWIPWAGGECPIPDAQYRQWGFKKANGSVCEKAPCSAIAYCLEWEHKSIGGCNFTHYRLIK